MAGQGIRKSTRCLGFSLGIVVAFSGSLFFIMDGACLAQAGELAQGESPGQSEDMDHHDHAEGTVDMMVPHQKHLGPHMKWTRLRTANADDARHADQIVQTLRQTLAKYKDYRVAMDDGYVPLHPDRKPKHYHSPISSADFWPRFALSRPNRPRSYTRKLGMVMSWRGRCTLRQRA